MSNQLNRQIIVLIGPSGCGKSFVADTVATKLRADPIPLKSDSYAGQWKNEDVSERISTYRKSVVIENGGGIFTAPIKKKGDKCLIDTCHVLVMVAPVELVNFCKEFKMPATRYPGTFREFSNGQFAASVWALCNNEEHPCGQSFSQLKDVFYARTRSACLYRVSEGSYKLGYSGSKKIGHFANEEAMIETMCSVTERNFEFQIFLIMWALARHIPIHTITYDEDTHEATFNVC